MAGRKSCLNLNVGVMYMYVKLKKALSYIQFYFYKHVSKNLKVL